MYEIEVTSLVFKGKPLVAQHRMVHDVLEKEIGEVKSLCPFHFKNYFYIHF